MSRLEDVYCQEGSAWAVARAVLLLVGSLVATVGLVAATASLIAGFGVGTSSALKMAALFGGGLLVGAFFVLFTRGPTRGRSRTLAVVGVVFAVVGLTLFWTTLPTGWTGHLEELPPVAIGTYAAGLLAVFAVGLADDADADESSVVANVADSENRNVGTESLGGVGTAIATNANERETGPASSVVQDGGEDGEDLQFFDGEDS